MSDIARAVQILRSGGLVAFPTETVYGLGADAANAAAVDRIFAGKGRPSTNPIIVHVADAEIAKRYARHWPATADELARCFWPGPLTLVLPKARSIVAQVSAGRDTVGLRVPNHPLALQLLRVFEGPVAAPSANRSTHVSPTTAQHVRDELGDRVDLVLDGGPCTVGIESTVLDLSADRPKILRPGGISREEIEQITGPVEVFSGSVSGEVPASSPGQHHKHYAPRTPAYRFEGQLPPADANAAMLLLGQTREVEREGKHLIRMPDAPDDYARNLYAILRELDGAGRARIFVQMPPDTPEWTAVRDRLIRATMPAVAAPRP